MIALQMNFWLVWPTILFFWQLYDVCLYFFFWGGGELFLPHPACLTKLVKATVWNLLSWFFPWLHAGLISTTPKRPGLTGLRWQRITLQVNRLSLVWMYYVATGSPSSSFFNHGSGVALWMAVSADWSLWSRLKYLNKNLMDYLMNSITPAMLW